MMKIRQKAEGYIMIIAFILGAMIVTLGLGVQKLLFTELTFAAQMLQSERAHFAAESGVEQALLWLQKNEIEHLHSYSPAEALNETTTHEVTINNNVSSFSFLIGPEEAKQFILRRDEVPTGLITSYEADTAAVEAFTITGTVPTPDTSQPNSFELNICLGSDANSIETVLANDVPQNKSNLGEEACIVQVYNQNQFSIGADGEPDEQNNEKRSMLITVENKSKAGITPHRAEITSIGKDGSRQKVITFGLEQNKSLFNRNLFVQ